MALKTSVVRALAIRSFMFPFVGSCRYLTKAGFMGEAQVFVTV
jgi:hypothetical protein